MRTMKGFLLCLLVLAGSGCTALSELERSQAATIAAQMRPQAIDCTAADACALPSPLHGLGVRAEAESTPQAPRHYGIILDQGQDALLARLNLIRSARASIDLQTYIFDKDDSARLVLDELLLAARRGVRVRMLVDQLSAIGDVQMLAALAGYHENLSFRVYNPSLNKAVIGKLGYLGSALCCFRRFNQRMHNKVLLIDESVGIVGGRNYQNDYFDWDDQYNFRDRDLLVAGPVAREIAASFEQFWGNRRSVPLERLDDVARLLLRDGVPELAPPAFRFPERVAAMSRDAGDAGRVRERLLPLALPLANIDYIADPPKPYRRAERNPVPAADELRALIANAQREVLLQTPYLVMSKPARELFLGLRQRPSPPRVIASTNSLAAADHVVVYAIANKYKRYHLRELGLQIYEYKPFPEDAPVDYATIVAATEAGMREAARSEAGDEDGDDDDDGYRARRQLRTEAHAPFSSGSGNRPVPLKRAGARIGIHAKSLVVDERVGVIGTHNFDPRSDHLNTEAVLIVEDEDFARRLADDIRRDISPANSWAIAPRALLPVVYELNAGIDRLSSALPLFDIWPWRYATSYEFVPGEDCTQPLPYDAEGFSRCYRAVGDFPEVSLGAKRLSVWLLMGFGGGLAPIL